MSDDRIIDLAAYLEARGEEEEERPLALRGTEGERRRFVLPLWRVAYVARAGWAGLVREGAGGHLEAVVVVDLRQDPARPEPSDGLPRLEARDAPPSVRVLSAGDLIVALGPGPKGRRWAIVLAERGGDAEELDRDAREDLLYLGGECAGLVRLLEV